MKETERDKRIKEALASLNRRVKRLTDELDNCMPDLVVATEIKLVEEALESLKKEFASYLA